MVMDKDISLALDSPISFNNQWGENQQIRLGFWARQVDGFRRDPDRRPSFLSREKSTAGADGTTFDAAGAAEATANSGLVRQLKGRHLQMIAIGGSIGTGLFVGSGKALANGGPAALVLGFSLVGAMLYCTVHALGEMAVAFPVAGSFSAYATRFLDPAWGFAMGWNYAMQWLVALPLEIVAATITIRYWGPTLPSPAWVAIFLMIILCVNVFFGVRGYAESEFAFSIIKVIAVIGFM
jgi:amino acid transporter